MGQPVVVTQKQSSRPGVVRYELNRTLTGTGHEIYRPGVEISGARPPDELARRLFDGVQGVGRSTSTAASSPWRCPSGSDAGAAKGIIEDLYTYYRPGVEPPSFDTPAPAE
ncbi:MAG: hypothetical protein R2704_04630 [Microthrixaceae bacterium]